MAFRLAFTKRFERNLKKLSPQEIRQVKAKLQILAENPMYPSLRVKRIQGTKSLFECSVNMDIRIIWCFDGEFLILTLDVGHHDILTHY